MSDTNRIPFAYCSFPLERDVTIDEARDEYFARENAESFIFQCADPACRQRLSAVNYKATDFIRAPHFRRINSHPHIPECIWSEYEESCRQDDEDIKSGKLVWQAGDSNYLRLFATANRTNIIDRFVIPGDEPEDNELERQFVRPRRKSENRAEYLRTYRHSTTVFYRLVDAFRSLTKNEKRENEIEIPDGNGAYARLSYRRAFVHISSIRRGRTDARVFYGSAFIDQIADEGFTVRFRNKATHYDPVRPDIQAAIFIPINDLNDAHLRRTLLESLINYSSSGRHCCCYIYGITSADPIAIPGQYSEAPRISVIPQSLKYIAFVDGEKDPKHSFNCEGERIQIAPSKS